MTIKYNENHIDLAIKFFLRKVTCYESILTVATKYIEEKEDILKMAKLDLKRAIDMKMKELEDESSTR